MRSLIVITWLIVCIYGNEKKTIDFGISKRLVFGAVHLISVRTPLSLFFLLLFFLQCNVIPLITDLFFYIGLKFQVDEQMQKGIKM